MIIKLMTFQNLKKFKKTMVTFPDIGIEPPARRAAWWFRFGGCEGVERKLRRWRSRSRSLTPIMNDDDDEDARGSVRNNAGADDGRTDGRSQHGGPYLRPRPSIPPTGGRSPVHRWGFSDSPPIPRWRARAPEIQSEFSTRSRNTFGWMWILDAKLQNPRKLASSDPYPKL